MNKIKLSDSLVVGEIYERNFLGDNFKDIPLTISGSFAHGIVDFHNDNAIWLFATNDPNTPYSNYIDLDKGFAIYYGQENNGYKTDSLIENATINNNTLNLFR